MGNFLRGLGVLILGFLIWVVFSVTGALTEISGEATTGHRVLMYIGFTLMALGPVVFWIVIPIKNKLAKRRRR